MSWLRDIVAPKVKAFIGDSSNVEDALWTKCPSCEKLVYSKELEENLMVCHRCSHHFQVTPKFRFDHIFDNTEYEEIEIIKIKDDPIKFKDLKKYTDRLRTARKKTGKYDAISIAYGLVIEKPVVVFALDFSFMGGSMGLAVGKSYAKAVRLAIDNNAALIGFTASGGARMQEGILSLMQMPATIASLCELKESKLPYINVFTNPTTGGVLASFSMLGDIHIAEPKALIGFAGARVIEKTIKYKLPDGFQSSEFLQKHGMIDIIVSRHQLVPKIKEILTYTMR
jgi:acetyl-CoA carboxylase carboxyl transferase subunit beta